MCFLSLQILIFYLRSFAIPRAWASSSGKENLLSFLIGRNLEQDQADSPAVGQWGEGDKEEKIG